MPDVYATVGIHPHDAAEATDGRLRGDGAARARLGRRWSALGEMGLDFFRNLSPRDVQDTRLPPPARHRRRRSASRSSSTAATRIRRRWRILAEERVGEVGGVMHCFSADVEVAERCLDLGPPDLAGRAGDLQERARAARTSPASCPRTASVVETDCPVPAARIRTAGQRNEPRVRRHAPRRTWPGCAARRRRRSAT